MEGVDRIAWVLRCLELEDHSVAYVANLHVFAYIPASLDAAEREKKKIEKQRRMEIRRKYSTYPAMQCNAARRQCGEIAIAIALTYIKFASSYCMSTSIHL